MTEADIDAIEAGLGPSDTLQRELLALARLGIVAKRASYAIVKVAEEVAWSGVGAFARLDPQNVRAWVEFAIAVNDARKEPETDPSA
jgi:hypothetical protein